MTTKDFIRKRDFYLTYVSYLILDFPSSPLFEVNLSPNRDKHHYLTFSNDIKFDNSLISCLVTRVTKYQFEFLQQKFKSFILACSDKQRSILLDFYSTNVLFIDVFLLKSFFYSVTHID